MKKFYFFSLLIISFIILTGCRNIINNIVHIPEFSDFTSTESFYYTTTDTKNLSADIDVCTTRFEFLTYDGDNTFVEIAYNNQSDRDKINFSYTDGNIKITKTNSSTSCGFIKVIDSYVRISIPKTLNEVNIDVNSYNTKADFQSLNVNNFTYTHRNGNVSVNGNITYGNIRIDNGNVTAENVSGKNINLESDNGNVITDGAVYEEFIKMNTDNGNISIEDAKTKSVTAKLSNGNISMSNSEIYNTASLEAANGNVDGNGINKDLTSLSGSFTFKTVNGNVTLYDVYPASVFLKTTNGNLNYNNSLKDKSITVTYSKKFGNTNFNINGNVTKID